MEKADNAPSAIKSNRQKTSMIRKSGTSGHAVFRAFGNTTRIRKHSPKRKNQIASTTLGIANAILKIPLNGERTIRSDTRFREKHTKSARIERERITSCAATTESQWTTSTGLKHSSTEYAPSAKRINPCTLTTATTPKWFVDSYALLAIRASGA
jgi:hypothetical protein